MAGHGVGVRGGLMGLIRSMDLMLFLSAVYVMHVQDADAEQRKKIDDWLYEEPRRERVSTREEKLAFLAGL